MTAIDALIEFLEDKLSGFPTVEPKRSRYPSTYDDEDYGWAAMEWQLAHDLRPLVEAVKRELLSSS